MKGARGGGVLGKERLGVECVGACRNSVVNLLVSLSVKG